MKISNEIKIGILVIIGLIALVFGIRFMQGKGIFEGGTDVVAFYENTAGLNPSAPVMLKGVQVGKVKNISLLDDQRIKVDIYINKGVRIPKGTIAQLASQSMISGDKMISLKFPSVSAPILKDNDTLIAQQSVDLLDNLSSEMSPMMGSVNNAVGNIDSLTEAVNQILNEQTQAYLKSSIANIDRTMIQISQFSEALNRQSLALGQIMGNVNSFSGNLGTYNSKINAVMDNAEIATRNLTGPEIKNAVKSLEEAAANINATLAKINSTDGTLGLLTRDRKLYDHLTQTTLTLDELLKDLKARPGRYINVSVFGSKTKE